MFQFKLSGNLQRQGIDAHHIVNINFVVNNRSIINEKMNLFCAALVVEVGA